MELLNKENIMAYPRIKPGNIGYKKYKVIYGASGILDREVEQLLNEGWELAGGVSMHSSGVIMQAMFKTIEGIDTLVEALQSESLNNA